MPTAKAIKKMASEPVKMDMTPMIDVTFLLLIFFMCTLHFKTLEGNLISYLPKEQGLFSTPPEKKPQEPVNVRLLKTPEGAVIWVGDAKLSGKNRYNLLYQKLKYIIERTPVPVVIDPDIDIDYQDIIYTLNTCRRINVRGADGRSKPVEVKFSAKALDEEETKKK